MVVCGGQSSEHIVSRMSCTSVMNNLNKENYNDNEIDKKLLYVVLTRALHYEYIFYKEEKSPLIG